MGAAICNCSPEWHSLKYCCIHQALASVQDWPPSNLQREIDLSTLYWQTSIRELLFSSKSSI